MKVKLSSLTTWQKIQLLRQQLAQDCLERSYQIDALIALFICKQHGLLLGPPGTGKTMLLELLCNVFVDTSYFSLLVGSDTKPDDFFGPVSLNALKDHEIYRRNTANRLPKAHLAYLDEIFKASTPMLNNLLKVINERIYYNPDPETIPLRTVVGSSNEIPNEGAAAAFADRFTWKNWVGYLQKQENITELWERSIEGRKSSVTVKMSLLDLDRAALECSQVTVKHVFPILLQLKDKLEVAGYTVSDRRWLSILKFLQAFAWVRRESTVTLDVIRTLLPDCIWQKPEEAAAIASLVNAEIREITGRISKIRINAGKAHKDFLLVKQSTTATTDEITAQAIVSCSNLQDLLKQLNDAEDSGFYESKDIERIRGFIQTTTDDIQSEFIKLQKLNVQQKIDAILQNAERKALEVQAKYTTISNMSWMQEAENFIIPMKAGIENIQNANNGQEFFAHIEPELKESTIKKLTEYLLTIKSLVDARMATL